MKNGVPWATVWGDELPWKGEAPEDWVMALNVIFASFRGDKFNWDNMRYEKPN